MGDEPVARPDGVHWTITEPGDGPSAPIEVVHGEFCPRCGQRGSHPACDEALRLEPPRFCAVCARRMVVQIVPAGWTARCVEHGEVAGGNAPD